MMSLTKKGLLMNLSFENKGALVTGAGFGMGLATAKAFVESGASVVLADSNEGSVHAAVKELVAAGHKALAVRCDVTDAAPYDASPVVEQRRETVEKRRAAIDEMNARLRAMCKAERD